MDLNTIDPLATESAAEWFAMLEKHPGLCEQIVLAIPYRPQEGYNDKLAAATMPWFANGIDVRPSPDAMIGWIERTRNNIAWQFLKTSDRKYLIMVDADITPSLSLPLLLARHDKPIVSGVCMTVNAEHGPMLCFTRPDTSGEWRMPAMKYVASIPKEGLVPTHHCGTGAICIRRDVLESFSFDGSDLPFLIPESIRLDSMKQGEMTKGEDIVFCIKARQKGYDIWVDLEAHCGHKKPFAMTWEDSRRDDTLDPASWVLPPRGLRITDNGV
jgi:hypothetical protein